MTKFQFSRIAAAAAAATLSCSIAFAGDTQVMPVTAKVIGSCTLGTMPTLDFGTLDQVLAPIVTPTAVNVTYNCTKGTAPTTFTIGGSSSGAFTGSLKNTLNTDVIAYSLAWTQPSGAGAQGTGFGSGSTPVSVSVAGTMAGGSNYQLVSAGTYNQSVSVVIAP